MSTPADKPEPFAPQPRLARCLPLGFYGIVCLVELLGIWLLTDGNFFYSLDDPYIHLAVAESVVKGQYGVNAGEFSSPSSSILWPFLLAPLELTSFGHLGPLFINLLVGALTVCVLQAAMRMTVVPTNVRSEWLASAATVLLTVCCNVIPLVFMGMEHSLQVLFVLTILVGTCREQSLGTVSWTCWLALILAPLIRYECAVVSLAFGACLAARGHAKWVVASATSSAAAMAAFTVFLRANGQGWLPNSVVAKAAPLSSELLSGILEHLASTARSVLTSAQGTTLCVFAGALSVCCVLLREPAKKRIALALLAASVGHLLIGKFGAFSRYESYIFALDIVGLAWLSYGPIRALLAPKPGLRVGLVISCFLLLLTARFSDRLLHTAPAARDMYLQQMQLHRFVVDFYRKPVAVNDLGLVSYRNEQYVLDLVGLASSEALHAQRTTYDSQWTEELTKRHQVELVMIYEHWFADMPASFIELGALYMPHASSAAGNEVAFFATSVEAARKLRPLLASFAQTLPGGCSFISKAATSAR